MRYKIPGSYRAPYIFHKWNYSPMDCMMPFSAAFMGSLSGSLEEGSPSQSQRYTASSWGRTPNSFKPCFSISALMPSSSLP